MSDVTELLQQLAAGESDAADELVTLLYGELRRMAQLKLNRESDGHTLQPTALVHEAYFKLVGRGQTWKNSSHFFAAAAEAMRRVLVDHARKKKAIRRGGESQKQAWVDDLAGVNDGVQTVVAVSEALDKMAQEHPEKVELVKLKYFAGLTLREAAEVLGLSISTADRHWAFARAWLRRELLDDQVSS